MRPDPAFLVAIALAFCGVVAIAAALIGQASLRRPRCRRCDADIRAHAWEADPRCACGARLNEHGAVRFAGRERSRSAAIAGTLMLAASVAVTGWQLSLRSRGLTWRELLPSSWEVANLRNGREVNEALRSLMRRCDVRSIEPADRAAAIDAAIAAVNARRDLVTATLARLVGHPAMLEEPHAAATGRALAALDAGIVQRGPPTVRLSPTGEGPLVIEWITAAPSGWSVVYLVDEVRLGERIVAGRSVQWINGSMAGPCDPALASSLAADGTLRVTVHSREFRVPSNAAAALALVLFAGEPCPAGLVHSVVERTDSVPVERPTPAGEEAP